MSGFEPGSSDNGNNRSANCATTTALVTMSLVISFMLYSNALNLSSLTSFLKLLKRLPHSSHHILNKLTLILPLFMFLLLLAIFPSLPFYWKEKSSISFRKKSILGSSIISLSSFLLICSRSPSIYLSMSLLSVLSFTSLVCPSAFHFLYLSLSTRLLCVFFPKPILSLSFYFSLFHYIFSLFHSICLFFLSFNLSLYISFIPFLSFIQFVSLSLSFYLSGSFFHSMSSREK